MIPEIVKEYSEKIVKLHDGNGFHDLKMFISDKVFTMNDSWFNEDKYHEVCEHIEKNVGVLMELAFIDKLLQDEKILTLWKARYSGSDIEVLWSIYFEIDFSKVVGLHVGW